MASENFIDYPSTVPSSQKQDIEEAEDIDNRNKHDGIFSDIRYAPAINFSLPDKNYYKYSSFQQLYPSVISEHMPSISYSSKHKSALDYNHFANPPLTSINVDP